MKPEFIEDYSNEHTSPEAEPQGEFDWPSLSAALGEVKQELSERDYADLLLALEHIVKWAMRGNASRRNFEKQVGRRILALAWVLSPNYFKTSPSLTALAESLGVCPGTMSAHTASASKTFGIVNKAQAHGWNRK